jgi:aldose 1-epimerase
VSRAPFGTTPDGRAVEIVTLTNASGMQARILTLGATIQSVLAPDRAGRLADVALGFADLPGYLADTGYVGATVGRVANRIANGRFVLDGTIHAVPANNGDNALHGGPVGFDRANWEVIALHAAPIGSVSFRHVSPDGDQGFPGALSIEASFSLGDDDVLHISYQATTDRPTIVNLTNHAYWNLAGEGEGSAMGHELTIPADSYLPTDAGLIPTGAFQPVDGTPFDFRRARVVGPGARDAGDPQIRIGRGYDHNFVIDRAPAATPRLLARLSDPGSGRTLELHSDQPGLQLYSGNFLDGSVAGKSGRLYRQGDAIVLEAQRFPDTPNRPEFGSVRLDPGEVYRHRLAFRFGVAR